MGLGKIFQPTHTHATIMASLCCFGDWSRKVGLPWFPSHRPCATTGRPLGKPRVAFFHQFLGYAVKPQLPMVSHHTTDFPNFTPPLGFSGTTSEHLLDLNTASHDDLVGLGLDGQISDQIVENRPYRNKLELLSRMVIPEHAYNAIRLAWRGD